MATEYWNTPISHGSDADFRTWGKEISDALAAAGALQMPDTGQINWASATRPATSMYAGRELWALNDSLHGSSPVIVCIEYGTGQFTADSPRLRVSVGTATDGSGNLVGASIAAVVVSYNGVPFSNLTNLESYVCVTEGFMGASLKLGYLPGVGAAGGSFGHFSVSRTVNLDGTKRSDAIVLAYTAANSSSLLETTLHFATGLTYTSSTRKMYCMIPNDITNSSVGSEYGVFKHYTAYPMIRSIDGLCTALTTEVGLGTQFTAALNGATNHNYVCVGSEAVPYGISQASANNRAIDVLCMLWE